ncbi:MAG: sensor domain-containing diguanylate cyclase [Sedimentibacter sp.]|uniref:sensor domain-containing diguanylate cyclase n=1 Tax=Sedimentibacter sp. TaxID=1960295 RepID=UPI0031585AB7
MDLQLRHADELARLAENEDTMESFREIVTNCLNSDLEELKGIMDELLKFAKKNNLNRTKGWAYYYLGWYNFNTSRYDKAVDCFLMSHDTFENANFKKGIVYACNGLTNAYCQIGQLKLANEWSLKGISLAEEIDDNSTLVILLINTGINYIQMQYYEKAREIFNAVELMDVELTGQQQVTLMLSMAEIEINSGDPCKALVLIEDASGAEEKHKIFNDICDIHRLRGMAYIKLHEYDVAESEFIKSYEYAREHKLIFEMCGTAVEWANLCIAVGRRQEAIIKLNDVIQVCISREINVLLKKTYFILYKIYKSLELDGNSLFYLEKYMEIDDAMYDYEQNQLMAKMSIQNARREADRYKSLYDRTELLSTIGQKIISNLNINSIIDIINEEINKLIEADYFGIAVYEKDKDTISFHFAGMGEKPADTVQFSDVEHSTFTGHCIKSKKDIILGNVCREYKKYIGVFPRRLDGIEGVMQNSMIYTPMIINDRVVGAMTVQNRRENAYDKNDLNTLKILANYSAIAIENAVSYQKIEKIATYDHLTKFLTKYEIVKFGNLVYDRCREKNVKFSVVMIDIDDFKKINDTYGHVYGDKTLGILAEIISKCIRNTDCIGRYGGDEFLLICPEAGSNEALEVAERIRRNIENKKFNLGWGAEISLTISLGVRQCESDDTSFIDVVKKADKCLYQAKDTGKNNVVCS